MPEFVVVLNKLKDFIEKDLWINKHNVWEQMPVVLDDTKASQVVYKAALRSFAERGSNLGSFKHSLQCKICYLTGNFVILRACTVKTLGLL